MIFIYTGLARLADPHWLLGMEVRVRSQLGSHAASGDVETQRSNRRDTCCSTQRLEPCSVALTCFTPSCATALKIGLWSAPPTRSEVTVPPISRSLPFALSKALWRPSISRAVWTSHRASSSIACMSPSVCTASTAASTIVPMSWAELSLMCACCGKRVAMLDLRNAFDVATFCSRVRLPTVCSPTFTRRCASATAAPSSLSP
mmetsp:Transcript_23297/g.47428  ORF Transcript_23297/g.47428 Transcript_23297/m.47428 type:complete len:203 (-) Transcript_23297:218-826(-)